MVSACAKFILGGEHSVVHKGKALALPLPQLRLSVEPHEENSKIFVNGKELNSIQADLIVRLKEKMGLSHHQGGLMINTEIPIGAGLGSSAAISVAIAKTYTSQQGRDLALLALEGEKIFHGEPSGIDPFTVALERPIAFSSVTKNYRELSTDGFVQENLCFALFDSGERHSTVELIKKVGNLKNETPLIWEDLISTLASNAQDMERVFENNPVALGPIMNDTHFRLLQLGVSTEKLDQIVEQLRNHEALGAKLTGAGGGGFVVGLFYKKSLSKLPSHLQPTYCWFPNE